MNKKAQKKKDREKMVRKKILKQREELRAEMAQKRKDEIRFEEEYKLVNGGAEPFLKSPEAIAAREERKQADVEKRLKKNLAILEALEAEFDKEHQTRKDLNDRLEEQGHHTVKEKLNALLGRAKQEVEKTSEEPAEWFLPNRCDQFEQK